MGTMPIGGNLGSQPRANPRFYPSFAAPFGGRFICMMTMGRFICMMTMGGLKNGRYHQALASLEGQVG